MISKIVFLTHACIFVCEPEIHDSFMTAHIAAHSSSNTVAILAQGTSWAVAVTQAFCCGWYIRTYISFETRKKNYPSVEVSAPKYSLAAQQ